MSMTPRKSGPGPLAGIRVLDLTQHLSGPFGSQILGDLGAEIIKIEPIAGDSTRTTPPHFIAGTSTYFTSINRNKRSIAVDLKQQDGVVLVKDLALACDIVFENYRPGVMARLGLSYDELSARKPGLVWCSLSGFGQDGPDQDRAAFDIVVQAVSGTMSLTGEKDGRPVRIGIPVGDVCAGLYAVIGILAALQQRNATGRGDYVDVGMLDVQAAMLCYQAAAYLHSGEVPGTQGRDHVSYPLFNVFTAQDGVDIAISGNLPNHFKALCQVLERPELLADERYATTALRNRNRATLLPVIVAAFREKPSAEIIAKLREAGVPAGPVNTIDHALAEPQIAHRDMVVELHGAAGERARVVGNPIKIQGSGRTDFTYPPRLGGDTRAILAEIAGYDETRIATLLESGVVGEYREKDIHNG